MGRNIFITGFSGSGKTTTGREVARILGWRFIDTDEEIVRAAGEPIEAIFSEKGEPEFRRLERLALAEACRGTQQVVSTGGGIVLDEGNRRLMAEHGVIVCLEATPETIRSRLDGQRAQARSPVARPLLDASDPLGRIRELKASRQPAYALAHWTVHTDGLTARMAAEEVLRGWRLLTARRTTHPRGAGDGEAESDLAATVETSSGRYPIWVGWGILEGLGEWVHRVLSPGAAYIITDEGARHHARRAQAAMEAAGIPTHILQIPGGEPSKNLDTVQRVYTWLARRRAERGHLILAVGGGVVGDLAGFVAATYLRGMPFGQVPTTLLAMVDAAIGGKVAVDLPSGKNLVGAFHQPRLVLADLETLQTLPARHLAAGWAEAIKHGLLFDEELLSTFEEHPASILALEKATTAAVIRRSVALKANIVTQDEKETLGLRVLLNYGHTIGHAIEAATGYSRILHGEAVSVGMMGAAYISNGMGLLSSGDLARQQRVLEVYGLPLHLDDLDAAAVANAMSMDKKTANRATQWVLLDSVGSAVVRGDVPDDLVQRTLQSLIRKTPTVS